MYFGTTVVRKVTFCDRLATNYMTILLYTTQFVHLKRSQILPFLDFILNEAISCKGVEVNSVETARTECYCEIHQCFCNLTHGLVSTLPKNANEC